MAEVTAEAMDRVLCYRNLLAAEDHLDEIVSTAQSTSEVNELEAMRLLTVACRDEIMPKEADKRFHCLVKHYSVAYEAAREVYKVSQSAEDKILVQQTRELLISALEKLWGKKIITCERCGATEEEKGEQHGATRILIND